MRERPIMFSGPMVRAILKGKKSQTRRVVKHGLTHRQFVCPSPDSQGLFSLHECSDEPFDFIRCPYGTTGEYLWVRETWQCVRPVGPDRELETCVPRFRLSDGKLYNANGERIIYAADHDFEDPPRWRPSIFMPRKASRITLEIIRVRCERVQAIGRDGRKAHDVLAEGIPQSAIDEWAKWIHKDDAPAHAYSVLWDSINGKKHPWSSNPWVWVIEFRRTPGR